LTYEMLAQDNSLVLVKFSIHTFCFYIHGNRSKP
jgi:hypothetical protein